MNLIKSLDLTFNLQEIQGIEECVKRHQEMQCVKSRLQKNSSEQIIYFFLTNTKGRKKEVGEIVIDLKIYQ